jgi:butyrate kinase
MGDKKQESKKHTICVINPGSTSTKIAIFSDENKIAQEDVIHQFHDDKNSQNFWDQFETRYLAVEHFLNANKINRLDAVVGRGGLLKPIHRGVYKVNETMIRDARKGEQGEHPSNMGSALAQQIAQKWTSTAFVVDPVSVDEFEPLARYSGHPLIQRRTLSHALNIRAAAIWCSNKMSVSLQDSNFIVGHLGGGISIAAVKSGRIIDVNDASSAGPFSPERTGCLPLQQLVDICFSGNYSKDDVKKMIMGEGGLFAYLGTADLIEIENRIENGDAKAKEVFQSMIYQISKELSGLAAVFFGKIDGIVLTGGLARSKKLINSLRERISFLATVTVFEGELEMEAMASGVIRVLSGEEKAKIYG